MNVHIRLAEPFWRSVGLRDLDLTLEPASRVDDLLVALRERYPRLSLEFDQAPPHVFIGDEEAEADSILEDGARVHLVWPVAGG
ncbi:MAG: hypothetical protein DCC59_16575 [Chloroflexi bacterium]|nr:MoaD/ThiS family protein [Anaerolineales bacterium]RIK47223.1 MAG: hypothetical protein DCC59_16575 [Chloroflexota bacterium]